MKNIRYAKTETKTKQRQKQRQNQRKRQRQGQIKGAKISKEELTCQVCPDLPPLKVLRPTSFQGFPVKKVACYQFQSLISYCSFDGNSFPSLGLINFECILEQRNIMRACYEAQTHYRDVLEKQKNTRLILTQ